MVCQGYADTYLLLCQRVGLPCVMITGGTRTASTQNFPTTANHAWNAIRLDGKWYAVDVTWDDIDATYSNEKYTALNGSVSISTLSYRYFADNRYFVEGSEEVTQDHKAYSRCKYKTAYWNIGAPPLECRRYTEETLIPNELKLTLHAPDQNSPAHFSDIQFALRLYYTGRVALWDIPNVTISLQDIVAFEDHSYGSGTCTVPAGKKYTVIGSTENDTVLKRGDDFSRALFFVENDAVLDLCFVKLDGEDRSVTTPLIQTDTATGTSESMISLSDSQVTGNRGACGISADGAVLLAGNCKILNNTVDGSKPSNLKLGNNGYIVVLGNLAESQIGVTTNIDCYFAWPNRYYDWMDSDRAAFIPDDPNSIFTYDSEEKGLYCTNVTTGDKNQKIYITYAAVTPSVSAIHTAPITLTNTTGTDLAAKVYGAMYSEDGKLLAVQLLGSVTLAPEASSDPIALPEAVNGTLVYKVFAVGSNDDPIAENVVYDFATDRET